VRVVVIGSGLAGVTVAEALGHSVTLVTAETHGYYSRPRLSHGFSNAASPVLKSFAALAPVQVLDGRTVERIDRDARRVVLGDEVLAYDRLILATGSAARIPPVLMPFRPQFLTLNSLDDLLTLRRRREKVKGRKARWAIIGGGLIGCEVASDLNKAGDEVALFHREARLLELLLDERQSQALHAYFTSLGIQLHYNQDIREIFPRTMYDGVIVSTGFAPRVELAREAGLATARGIVVDDYLRTADPAIYAVGDVAEVEGKLYPFVSPIRSQALWLAAHLAGRVEAPWLPPRFTPIVKIHGFKVNEAIVRSARADVGRIPTATLFGDRP
jgi:NAD(P)H-nitrite reductase large subunit